MVATETHGTPTPDDPLASREAASAAAHAGDLGPSQGFEEEDVNVGPILRMLASVAVMIGIVVVGVFQLVNIESQKAEAAAAAVSGNPALREAELAAIRKLNQFDVLGEGRYQIPIDRAIDLMVNEARKQTNRTYSSEMDLLPAN